MIWERAQREIHRSERLYPITQSQRGSKGEASRGRFWCMSRSVEKTGRKYDIKLPKWKNKEELHDSQQCFYAGTSAHAVGSLLTQDISPLCQAFFFLSLKEFCWPAHRNTPLVWTTLPQLMHVTSITRLLYFRCELYRRGVGRVLANRRSSGPAMPDCLRQPYVVRIFCVYCRCHSKSLWAF